MSKNKVIKKEVVEVTEQVKSVESVEILDSAIPSQLIIIVKDEVANVRLFPTHIAQKVGRKSKGAKLNFDDLVKGALVANSDKWYKIDGGYIHSSQVEEVNEKL